MGKSGKFEMKSCSTIKCKDDEIKRWCRKNNVKKSSD